MLGTTSPRAGLSPAPGPLDHFAPQIKRLLALQACWFEPFPFDGLLPRLERGRVVLPRTAPGARSYRDWQPGQGIELPVRYRSLLLGRFVLVPARPTCGVAIPAELRHHVIEIAERAGADLARHWIALERGILT